MRAARTPLLLTVAALVLLVTIAGCGSSSNKSSNNTTSSSAPTAADSNSAAHGAGPGQPCHAASSLPPAAGKPDVPMPATAPAKLTIKDLKVGTGPVVKPGATVVANYVGVSCSTGTQFDSSWDRGQPASFPLTQVIPGWTQGIPGMRVGGRRLLVIPPDLGYGNQSPSPDIKPGETLVFVVDVVSVQ
jgi:FKBP-type peptidyl-prolyl cis-trans isomerase